MGWVGLSIHTCPPPTPPYRCVFVWYPHFVIMLHAPTKSEKLAYLVQDCPEYLVTAAVAGEGGSCTAATAVGLAAAGEGARLPPQQWD